MGNACRCGLRGRRVRALDPDALGIVEKVFNKMAPDQKAGGTIGNLTSNFTTATIRTTVEVRSFLETARKFMGDATEIDVDVLDEDGDDSQEQLGPLTKEQLTEIFRMHMAGYQNLNNAEVAEYITVILNNITPSSEEVESI
mmetsp:Transcript_6868/g.16852  ORF Transcript_6868/g.16852 Transcript_6868/m.16852 type:complete len:142 (-) Transcript_6868:297-722(-)